MLSIHLKDLVFFANHGVYEAEQKLGGRFLVNVHIHYFSDVAVVRHLYEVVNYENIFKLVDIKMAAATPLMETLAMEICKDILSGFPQVHGVFASIEKTNPPIPSLKGSVVVSYQAERGPDPHVL